MLSRTAENYLRIIYEIFEKKGFVRPSDLAKALNVSAPTVTEMLVKLGKEELVIHEKRGSIRLTKKGENTAETIKKRYEIFLKLFKMAGVPNSIAYEDACLVEHYVSEKTAKHIGEFVKRLETTQICKKRRN
ncbi:metal-dependent transcriptional regulator [Candidatus Micrarchaeota archaeon]|nr:metal-dependent transcriptional regulator [Candidatus Micrarchaeota archaeon]